jgi:hypothetical protein
MSPTEMRALVERYIDAYNRMDVDEMLLAVHRDVKFENISGGVVNARTEGIDELKALAQQSLALFAERHQRILSFETDGPGAAASIAFRAVLAMDMPNGLRQGQVMSLSGRSAFEFKDGAICKITDIS